MRHISEVVEGEEPQTPQILHVKDAVRTSPANADAQISHVDQDVSHWWIRFFVIESGPRLRLFPRPT